MSFLRINFARLLLFFCILLATVFPVAQADNWIYTIKAGDNLWNLTESYMLDLSYVKKLQTFNNIPDPWHIPPGTKIKIPSSWLRKHPMLVRVHSIQGQADLIDEQTGKSTSLMPGSIIIIDDTIRTSADTTVILVFIDGSRLALQADSLLKIKHLGFYEHTGMSNNHIRLEKGRLETQVTPQTGNIRRFKITTPATVTSVRGTDYRISAEPETAESRAEVLEGSVAVSSSNISRLIPEGYGTIAQAGQPPAPPIKLLAAPEVLTIPSVIERVPVQFSLPALPTNQGYRVQIARTALFNNVLFDRLFTSGLIRGPDLPDGKYQLRVRGIDEQGLEGNNAELGFILNARPEAPFPLHPEPGQGILEETPAFQWSRLKNSKYHFQIAVNSDFDNPIVDITDYSDVDLTINNPLDLGKYYWRVASIDEQGDGPFSDAQLFRRILPAPEMEMPEISEDSLMIRSRSGLPGQQYHFQMAEDESFSQLLVDQQTSEPQLEIQLPESGEYFIRIRMIDPDGFTGPFGTPQIIDIPNDGLYWWLLLLPLLALIAL